MKVQHWRGSPAINAPAIRANAGGLFLTLGSLWHESQEIHVDAFRDLLVVVLCSKGDHKLLSNMKIHPAIHRLIGSSMECYVDGMLPKLSWATQLPERALICRRSVDLESSTTTILGEC